MIFKTAMIRRAYFDKHAGCQRRRQTQARPENFKNQWIANANEFHAPSNADTQRFQTVGVIVIGLDIADHGAHARSELIEADKLR